MGQEPEGGGCPEGRRLFLATNDIRGPTAEEKLCCSARATPDPPPHSRRRERKEASGREDAILLPLLHSTA